MNRSIGAWLGRNSSARYSKLPSADSRIVSSGGRDWRPPLETIRLSAEGTFEYRALLFLPSHAPMDLFMRESKRGVQLYVKRVFIMDAVSYTHLTLPTK